MNSKKVLVLAIAAVLVVAASVGGGYLLATKFAPSSSTQGAIAANGTGGAPQNGGPFADMTDAERTAFEAMTDEEKQAYMEEKGISAPTGDAAQGGRGAGGPGGAIEGTVASVDGEKFTVTITSGGSSTIYLSSDTVVAAVSGKSATVSEGATVMVYTTPEADGVTSATTVIIK